MRLTWIVLAALACADKTTPTASGETGTTTEPTPTPTTGPERVAAILALTPDPVAGAQSFAANCSYCHGVDGSGVDPNPALTDRVPLLTDDQVVSTVLEGKGNMDSYAALPNQEIANIVDHVIMSFGGGM
jgi:mono/diheme cytochrome c family protein